MRSWQANSEPLKTFHHLILQGLWLYGWDAYWLTLRFLDSAWRTILDAPIDQKKNCEKQWWKTQMRKAYDWDRLSWQLWDCKLELDPARSANKTASDWKLNNPKYQKPARMTCLCQATSFPQGSYHSDLWILAMDNSIHISTIKPKLINSNGYQWSVHGMSWHRLPAWINSDQQQCCSMCILVIQNSMLSLVWVCQRKADLYRQSIKSRITEYFGRDCFCFGMSDVINSLLFPVSAI